MTESRARYYILPLCGGLIYFFSYTLLVLFLYYYLMIIDMIYLIASYGWLFIFIIKDVIDEINIQGGKDPVGPDSFEHAPFIFFISFYAFLSLYFYLNIFLFILKMILFIASFCDGIFDILQDLRVR